MHKQPPPPSKHDLIALIASVAKERGLDRLPQDVFLQSTGLSKWALDKHFDSWTDACRAADIGHGLALHERPTQPEFTSDDCLAELKRVAALRGADELSSKQYQEFGRISAKAISRRFGSWHRALEAADLKPTVAAVRQRPVSREECVHELRRVGASLESAHLTSQQYDSQGPDPSSYRIVRIFGSWHAALKEAGLKPSPNFIREVALEKLAEDFLTATTELGRIPTIRQLTRRSEHVSHTFAGKHGGYATFKVRAIEHILAAKTRIPAGVRRLFESELANVPKHAVPPVTESPVIPHRQGRSFNFRAFAYAPTTEHDVVQLFGAVAHELGFEILANRSAFPDCEARRKQPGTREAFVKCLIEYEFASAEYRRHKHPSTGCDLVVCWQHDWAECPIEVLELKTAVRSLPGWQ